MFGIWFALQLVRMGHGPVSGTRAVVRALLGVVATAAIIGIAIASKILGDGQFSLGGLLMFTAAIAVGAAVAWSGWPELGRVLLAYAFAARIPVAIVMLVAMLANWGTHYDVAPPDFPEMGVFMKWLMIGALPQFTTWIAVTVLLGALFGAIAGAIASRGPKTIARTEPASV